MKQYDAVIVGSGPNGLAAGITMARAGFSVLVIEAKETIGGGTRSAAITLPGFLHDICSAIHPLGVASPFFQSVPLQDFGLEWIEPDAPLAHPMGGDRVVFLERSLDETVKWLGADGKAYRRLIQPFLDHSEALTEELLGPFPLPPRHPFLLARFGLTALRSAYGVASSWFKGEAARAIFSGTSAHSILPLEKEISASFGVVLSVMAHSVGWNIPRGGSQSISNAMAAYLQSLGGEVVTGWDVKTLDELPSARVRLLDLTPRQVVRIAGKKLPEGYVKQLCRYRYGPGVFKVDYALSEPVPWKAVECRRAGTVHLGGTMDEIAASERSVWRGEHPEWPFILAAQQSLFDPSRAPAGKHTLWAYCHVPNGSTVDMTDRIERQIERFAPGFRDTILARSTRGPAQFEQYNANYLGGDIIGGVQDIWQLYSRPIIHLKPYKTPLQGVYICSSSTPPGGGVHGMCGYHAAKLATRQILQK